MLSRLADRFVLQPTTYAIPAGGKTRRLIDFAGGAVEAWVHRTGDAQADLFILKFAGAGGRAERATNHPAEHWSDLTAELWAINPPGYGGSNGRPSLQTMAAVAQTALHEIQRVAAGRPVIVTGNSLGTIAALYVASACKVDGLILRNPLPLRELIVGRFGWWSFWLGAALIARQVPAEMDSIRNAARACVPAVFVSSGKDRTVPPRYQRPVIEAYAGEKRVLLLPKADHATPLETNEERQYRRLLQWLRERVLQSHRTGTSPPA